MKKFFSIATAVIIATSLASCGAKNANSNTTDTNSKSAAVSNIPYTKEITYFPSYNGAKVNGFTPSTKEAPLATAKYTIENVTDVKVYEYYENTLKKDGWTITEGKKHFSIAAKKDKHIVNIMIQKMDKNVILVVTSK